jgi:hypothetical protein
MFINIRVQKDAIGSRKRIAEQRSGATRHFIAWTFHRPRRNPDNMDFDLEKRGELTHQIQIKR